MAKWANINNNNNNFRLLCDNDYCSLSIANLLSGKIHLTTIHGKERHSYTFSNEDMLFIVSQYINNLNKEERLKLIRYFSNF